MHDFSNIAKCIHQVHTPIYVNSSIPLRVRYEFVEIDKLLQVAAKPPAQRTHTHKSMSLPSSSISLRGFILMELMLFTSF